MLLSVLAAVAVLAKGGHAAAASAPTAVAPASAPAAAAAPATLKEPAISPKTETECGTVIVTDPKAKPEFHPVAGLKVLGGPVKIVLPASDKKPTAIYCKRDTIIPGPGDGRVLFLAREPLVLEDGSRQGVLQMNKDGAYVYRMTLGTLSDVEKQSVVDRLNIFEANLRALVAQAKAQQAKSQDGGAPKSADEQPVTTKK
jgi:hypothetical protein